MAGKSEKNILAQGLIDVSALQDLGVMAWRNNTGQAWQGEQVRIRTGQVLKMEPGMVVLKNARPIRFGLPGSGDILGVAAGRAFSLEAKAEAGRLEASQPKFQAAWERAGGAYGVFRSAEEAVAFVRGLLGRK